MILFECDYAEGAHPRILERLIQTNDEQTVGYSEDPHCEHARQLIKKLCGNNNVDVHFLVGGTQTNTVVISSALRPHQGVLAVDFGHINVHETGAIEAKGHKVLTVPTKDGKITPQQIEVAYHDHWNDVNHEHIVQPAMVYISNPTELGTIYTRTELQNISETCRRLGLLLFVDGARLGYGLMAEGNDVSIADLATFCDAFYIGGTKCGALFGEAVVLCNDMLKRDFRYLIKQHGALLAKGRLLGIQFECLFEDDLYFRISKHANQMAMQIREAFLQKGFSFYCDSFTNQQFPIVPNEAMEKLSKKYLFSLLAKIDESHTAIRFCTSWATRQENVSALINDINNL